MAKAECDRIMTMNWDPGSISNHQTDSSIMAKLLNIAKTKDVPLGQAAAFTIEGQKIALFNVEGTYYAIGDTCTHRGGPLSEGDVQGTKVTCPWHGADFDLKTRCFGAASAE
jgi:nitrite reductase/ring-hydroxylating ferredoxin subunit